MISSGAMVTPRSPDVTPQVKAAGRGAVWLIAPNESLAHALDAEGPLRTGEALTSAAAVFLAPPRVELRHLTGHVTRGASARKLVRSTVRWCAITSFNGDRLVVCQ